jgi:biotin carboxylase
MQRDHGIGQGPVLVEAFVCSADRGCRACTSDEAWVRGFQRWKEDGEQEEDGLMILSLECQSKRVYSS